MSPQDNYLPIGGSLIIILLVLGVHAVRRISATDPSGRHWLLRSLAVLSPICLLAGLALGVIGPRLNGGPEPAHIPGLWNAALLLVLLGALMLPVLWRMMVHRWLGRPAAALPFFHASRTSLLVLFVLAAVYMKVARDVTPALMPWSMAPGLLAAAVRTAVQLVHIALLSVLLTLSMMAVRAVVVGFIHLISRPFRRPSRL
ncbi:hypothetical protein [uncultured Stenotrophomonas sp.]|uniref:hypothetical protein n=1 Tax=uncultured Stenotrophomonas sp. TaxID=165438 RepID=UPI0025D59B36|nr:hypothetical protein [uncultured Stenotrophomonas sp.]